MIFIEYNLENVYKGDETAHFYNSLSTKTMALSGGACHGGKVQKDKLASLLMSDCNERDKYFSLIIGESIAKVPQGSTNLMRKLLRQ